MATKTIQQRFENIVKPNEDKRKYLGLKLTNDLKVLLISDPETDISAASLSVNVGSMSDPWEIQGLAHFLEHMLFMGTKKVRLLFQIIYNRLMKNYLFYIVRSIQMKMNIVNFYHNMVEIPMLTLLMV